MLAKLVHEAIIALPLAANLATVVGIFFLVQQIALNRKATQCHLINELEKEFAGYYSAFAKLKAGGPWHEKAHLSPDEISLLENLASFCEKLKHFKDRGILNWKTLDLMFRNRFFLIMQNPNVLAWVIEPCRNDWEAAMELELEWRRKLPEGDARRR